MVVLSCSVAASGNDCQPWNAVSHAAVRCIVSSKTSVDCNVAKN
jgi:hypothetical protein